MCGWKSGDSEGARVASTVSFKALSSKGTSAFPVCNECPQACLPWHWVSAVIGLGEAAGKGMEVIKNVLQCSY